MVWRNSTIKKRRYLDDRFRSIVSVYGPKRKYYPSKPLTTVRTGTIMIARWERHNTGSSPDVSRTSGIFQGSSIRWIPCKGGWRNEDSISRESASRNLLPYISTCGFWGSRMTRMSDYFKVRKSHTLQCWSTVLQLSSPWDFASLYQRSAMKNLNFTLLVLFIDNFGGIYATNGS